MAHAPRLTRLLAAMLPIMLPAAAEASPGAYERTVKPSAVDPAVTRFDEPHVILSPRGASAETPLVIFLPGTSGRPQNVVDLLRTIEEQGYRVIGLEYDDEPAVMQVCPQVRDAGCAAKFRRMRMDGSGPGAPGVSNPPAESIEARLVALLRALATANPGQGWETYLDGDHPRWERIVVSGLSQGAGMAAYIAKIHRVRRVVLFSSPWDFTLPGRKLAPWIGEPGATPPGRWYAEYHAREDTADLLARSYAMLNIPADHVLVFKRELPSWARQIRANPYHGITVRDVAYAPQWRTLFGKPSDPVE